MPQTSKDYIPHHEPFQYYRSTANPAHTPPASPAEVGHDGPADHQYDLTDFWTAVDRGSMPSVSFLKAPAYARRDYVDHSVTDQSSILRFIEDNWSLGRIGDASFDEVAGSLHGLFDFGGHGHGFGSRRLILDPATGEPEEP